MTSFGKFIKRLLLALMVLVIAFHVLVAGLLLIWKTQPINNSMFMLTHRITGGDVSQTWVDYDAIAKSAKQAAIVSEDSTFSQHNGFDIKGIKAAQKKTKKVARCRRAAQPLPSNWLKTYF